MKDHNPNPVRTVRSFGLTQKGLTATCLVCEGVGAVLASRVYDGSTRVFRLHNREVHGQVHEASSHDPRNQVYVDDQSVLMPCPACFSDAAVLTFGL